MSVRKKIAEKIGDDKLLKVTLRQLKVYMLRTVRQVVYDLSSFVVFYFLPLIDY